MRVLSAVLPYVLVPYVISFFTCLVPYVFSCLTSLMLWVPLCLMCLLPYVLLCFTCLVPYVLFVSRALYLSCLVPHVHRALCVSHHTCSRVLRASCLKFSRVSGVFCALAPHVPCAMSVLVLLVHQTIRAPVIFTLHLLQVFQP